MGLSRGASPQSLWWAFRNGAAALAGQGCHASKKAEARSVQPARREALTAQGRRLRGWLHWQALALCQFPNENIHIMDIFIHITAANSAEKRGFPPYSSARLRGLHGVCGQAIQTRRNINGSGA